MSKSDEDIYGLILQPVYACFLFVILFFLLVIFAEVSVGGSGASAGLIEEHSTLSDFSPVFGVTMATGVIVLFVAFGSPFKKLYKAFLDGKFDSLFKW